MPLVAGVDSSTQSVKVEVRDAHTGDLVASGRAAHPPTTPPRSEQDPAAWWAAFEEAWAEAGAPAVAAMAVGAQQHGMVTLDEHGDVVRPAKLWNDTESAPDAAWLVDRLGGPEATAAAVGSVPTAAFTVTKLSWLHRCEPEAWARVRRVGLPHDWLTHRLTGAWTTDRGDASGTGYWSPSEGGYRLDVLQEVDPSVDWDHALPAVLGPGDVAGEWRGAVVAPGTGDNMAAALALALRPGDVVVSLGTSGTVYALSTVPVADPTGIVAGFASADGAFLPLVCTLNATKVTDAVARLLGADRATFDALALAAPVGADGLVLLPYLDGERTPDRPTATGVLGGLRSEVTREQLARAAVEGVICGLLHGLDALGAHVPVDGRLLVVGGGARSAAYRQALADLAQREVHVPVGDELVATGAAVQAAAVLHGCEPREVAAAWRAGHELAVVQPAPGSADAAAAARAAHADRRARES
jgi:xylulokinase